MGQTIATAPVGRDILEPTWLVSALGVEASVAVLGVRPLGGSGGACRIALHYDPPGAGPASVVVKAGGTGRAPGAAERELRLLVELAPALGAALPRVLAASRGEGAAAPLLVLEDLAPLRPGDQQVGMDPEHVAAALEQIARVHAAAWGDAMFARLRWLNRGPRQWPALARLMPDLVQRFCERHAATLSGPELAAVERLATCASRYFGTQPGPWSIRHGDLRAAHVLHGAGRAALVDWQATELGPPVADVAFLVGGSLTIADRRAHELDLLRVYHDALLAAGVTRYPWERCFADHRRHALGGLFRAMASAAPEPTTPHGDALLCTMARRHAAHADDLESATAL